MERGQWVDTPRFCKVMIQSVMTPEQARKQGFTERTSYYGDYDIFGKVTSPNHMQFAAVVKEKYLIIFTKTNKITGEKVNDERIYEDYHDVRNFLSTFEENEVWELSEKTILQMI